MQQKHKAHKITSKRTKKNVCKWWKEVWFRSKKRNKQQPFQTVDRLL